MATLTYAAFVAKYETYFADNTSQAITESRMREFKDDIADSFAISAGLNWAVVQIGDWDMDTNSSVTVSSGLDGTKTRVLGAVIRSDTGTILNLCAVFNSTGDLGGSAQIQADGDVVLYRTTGGVFDNTGFNSTSYNRGWITIGYVS